MNWTPITIILATRELHILKFVTIVLIIIQIHSLVDWLNIRCLSSWIEVPLSGYDCGTVSSIGNCQQWISHLVQPCIHDSFDIECWPVRIFNTIGLCLLYITAKLYNEYTLVIQVSWTSASWWNVIWASLCNTLWVLPPDLNSLSPHCDNPRRSGRLWKSWQMNTHLSFKQTLSANPKNHEVSSVMMSNANDDVKTTDGMPHYIAA